jgi:hypothetical protein
MNKIAGEDSDEDAHNLEELEEQEKWEEEQEELNMRTNLWTLNQQIDKIGNKVKESIHEFIKIKKITAIGKRGRQFIIHILVGEQKMHRAQNTLQNKTIKRVEIPDFVPRSCRRRMI